MKTSEGLNTFNLFLIGAGLLLISTGLYRTVPLKINKLFYWQNGPLIFFLLLGICFFWQRYNPGQGLKWSKGTIAAAGMFLPVMILICLLMALGGLLVGMYKEEIVRALTRHASLSTLISSLMAPTPTTAVKVIEEMWTNKSFTADFLFFLNAASIWSIPLFMLRSVGFANQKICLKMYLFGFIMSLIAFPLRHGITWIINLMVK